MKASPIEEFILQSLILQTKNKPHHLIQNNP